MIYQFARFENGSIKEYAFHSYEEAKQWVDAEIEEFKLINHVKQENNDKYFLSFKSELQECLSLQKEKDNKGQVMENYLKCNVCTDSDHEGQFCRCESRNMQVAREKRSRIERTRKESSSTSQPERLSEKTSKEDAIV